jgi:hypothetical protein
MKTTMFDERFWQQVDKRGPLAISWDGRKIGRCWVWIGATTGQPKYGFFSSVGRGVRAHVFAYREQVGPIPRGLVLDHVCRNPLCVRPAHLEPVTNRENTIRGKAGEVNAARQRAKQRCPKGHPYSGSNLYVNPRGERQCKSCQREREKAHKARRAA